MIEHLFGECDCIWYVIIAWIFIYLPLFVPYIVNSVLLGLDCFEDKNDLSDMMASAFASMLLLSLTLDFFAKGNQAVAYGTVKFF